MLAKGRAADVGAICHLVCVYAAHLREVRTDAAEDIYDALVCEGLLDSFTFWSLVLDVFADTHCNAAPGPSLCLAAHAPSMNINDIVVQPRTSAPRRYEMVTMNKGGWLQDDGECCMFCIAAVLQEWPEIGRAHV